MAPLSLRFKRKNQTVFLFCEPTDTFSKIKLRVSAPSGSQANLGLLGCTLTLTLSLFPPLCTLLHLLLLWLCPQLLDAVSAKEGSDIKLYAPDKETAYADEAIVADFALQDSAVIFLSLNGEAVSE